MALIRKDAIKRAAIIDAEMGWLRGTALGKLSMLWHTAQEDDGKSIVSRRLLLEWACVEPEHADRFIELCCLADTSGDGDFVHFLERRRDDGRFFIVGNPDEIQRVKTAREQAVARGNASAEARKRRTGSAVPPGARNHPDRKKTESDFESSFEEPFETGFEKPFETLSESVSETNAEKPPNPSALALANASALPSATTTTTRAPAREAEPAEVVVVGESEDPGPPADPPPPAVSPPAESSLTPLGLIALWNAHRGELPEVLGPTPERLELAEARLSERPEPEHWRLAIKRLASLPFANGEVTGWVASFDWLVEAPGKTLHVLEGRYDPRGKKRRRAAAAPPEDAEASEPLRCFTCWGTGLVTASRRLDDGPEVASFRCACEAGHGRMDHEAWDDEKAAAGWKANSWNRESFERWQARPY